MAELATPPSSRTLVKRAGNILAKKIADPQTEAEKAELAEWFRIAHQWRRAHLVPLRSIREELRYRAKQQQQDVVVVGRLKRMSSIRRKLPRRSLHQIQDIGGCRAIFTTMEAAETVIEGYRLGDCKHELIDQSNYILNPKRDGYRSHHLVFRFRGEDPYEAYDGLRIEVQIRTQLQHAWATAVEAVGLYLNQDLKFRSGDERWLRLFQLMASEIAVAENLPIVAETPRDQTVRRREIKNLDCELNVLRTLENFRHTIKETENVLRPQTKFYLIQYDNTTRTVSVKPCANAMVGSTYYDCEEEKSDPKNAVLVEVDKMEDLKNAYPNYFLDVALFTSGVRNVLRGEGVGIPPALPQSRQNLDIAAILRKWKSHRLRRQIFGS